MLLAVFGHLFKLGAISKYYPVSLRIGMGMSSLVTRESLLRRLNFSRFIIPTSAILTAPITFGVNSVVGVGASSSGTG